ncbi:MAG: hypothetical protein IRZ04_02770 [Rhodospirillales bacterium]|nr:hypothetical protein [Rhodospirillales bacterium]
MRLLLASLLFLATVLDMNFGAATGSLDIAALLAGILLVSSVVIDFVWLDRLDTGPHPSDAPSPET